MEHREEKGKSQMPYMIAKAPTPMFSTPYFPELPFKHDSSGFVLDKKGEKRALEGIALPNTVFEVLETLGDILKVRTNEYPDEVYVYKDQLVTGEFHTVRRELPSILKIIQTMKSLVGRPYVWGGNWPEGISYPGLDCKGVDCSGLLYYAANGNTARNTSGLMTFGDKIDFPEKPCDLIVWRGHVIIVISETEVIESRHPEGVIITNLKQRLEEIREKSYVVRRWHPDA
jgi:cell wall-associated NlpC family hydrolase